MRENANQRNGTSRDKLGYQELWEKFEGAIDAAREKVDAALAELSTGDPSDPSLLLKLQQAMTAWTSAINVSSGTLKTLKDCNSGVIQRM